MQIISLGSGSSGNAFIFHTNATTIVVDCGIGVRKIRAELNRLGVNGQVDGILISHEHIDHVSALKSLLRTEHCPVFATAGTIRSCKIDTDWQIIRSGDQFAIGELEITPVEVSHDAAEPCGFLISSGSLSAVFVTDLGIPNIDVSTAVSLANIVVIESNYDEGMLRTSPYPASLKRRIQGPLGHLSNDDCATLLAGAASSNIQSVWLAHLSEINNHPDIAVANSTAALAFSNAEFVVRALPRSSPIDLLAV